MGCPCAVTAAEFPLTIIRGDTVRWCFTFSDTAGAAINTGGWHVWLILRKAADTRYEDAFKLRLIVPNTPEAVSGSVVLTIHSSDTATLVPGKYLYEFKRVLPGVMPKDVWTFKFDTKPAMMVTDTVVIPDDV